MPETAHPDAQPDPWRNPGPDPAWPVNDRGRAYLPGVRDDEKTWALFSHLSLLAHLVLPMVAIAAPLAIWLVHRDKSAYIEDHAKEAVNFQITLILYNLMTIPLAIITCGLGAFLPLLLYPLGLVGMILAAAAANRGEFYRYPMTFRFIN